MSFVREKSAAAPKPSTRAKARASSVEASRPASSSKPKKAAARKAATPKKSKPAVPPTTPQALLDFMVTRWKAPSRKMPTRVPHADGFAARRKALSKRFPGELLVIPTGHEKVRANDTHYPFRPGTDFYYLTGNLEPDCVLVLEPRAKGGHRSVLYAEPNPGKTDATFFTDRVKGELWVGPRLGIEQSRHRFGVDEARPLAELPALLGKHRRSPKLRVLRGLSASCDGATARSGPLLDASPASSKKRAAERDRELAEFLSELRLVKDSYEVKQLAASIASTHRGFDDVIERLASAQSEREVEGVFFLRARVEGNDVGYGTIAAAGAHACTLHWTRNDGPVKRGDLLLLDAGVEGTTLYTADVTRTLPVSGRFTEAQRRVYELVLAAQEAALAAVKPGADFLAPHHAAMRVLTEGLVAWGILKVTAEEALRDDQQLYKRYTLHGTSHMLGLDVHDCASARQTEYRYGKLTPGMVLTVEPGLYFQIDDLTAPAELRGIGVRIEDDVLVTASGHRNLSEAIPRGADEVEAWMQEVWARRTKR